MEGEWKRQRVNVYQCYIVKYIFYVHTHITIIRICYEYIHIKSVEHQIHVHQTDKDELLSKL